MDQQASVQVSASRTEDSARTAYEELMLEEEQAATKAAAKKAKKLKQKAKKKSKQQAAPMVADEPTAQPSLEDEEEEDQFRLPQAAGASIGPEAALDVPSAEQLPSALRLLHVDTGLPTTATARAMLATDGAGPQQAPLLDIHGLNQAEDASSAIAATEHEDSKGSHSNSSQLGAGTASGGKADSDAHFLQALFCCPITKVGAAALHTCTSVVHAQISGFVTLITATYTVWGLRHAHSCKLRCWDQCNCCLATHNWQHPFPHTRYPQTSDKHYHKEQGMNQNILEQRGSVRRQDSIKASSCAGPDGGASHCS